MLEGSLGHAIDTMTFFVAARAAVTRSDESADQEKTAQCYRFFIRSSNVHARWTAMIKGRSTNAPECRSPNVCGPPASSRRSRV